MLAVSKPFFVRTTASETERVLQDESRKKRHHWHALKCAAPKPQCRTPLSILLLFSHSLPPLDRFGFFLYCFAIFVEPVQRARTTARSLPRPLDLFISSTTLPVRIRWAQTRSASRPDCRSTYSAKSASASRTRPWCSVHRSTSHAKDVWRRFRLRRPRTGARCASKRYRRLSVLLSR